MKFRFLIIILFISTNIFAQLDKAKGKWYLDFVKYKSGEDLEIENPLFSIYGSLNIQDDYIILNDFGKSKAKIQNYRITTKHIKFTYRFDNKYLIINEDDSDKEYYYLRALDFRKKNPDLKPKKLLVNNDTVIVYNELLNVDLYDLSDYEKINKFNEMHKSFKKYTNSDRVFKASFILTADNKIQDVKVIKSLDKKFDDDFIDISEHLNMFYKNNTGLNVLMEHTINMYSFFKKRSANELEFLNNYKIAKYYFNAKQYKLAHEIFLMLYSSEHLLRETDKSIINDIKNKLVVTSIYTQNSLETCLLLNEIKEDNYFNVKNFLRKYCPN